MKTILSIIISGVLIVSGYSQTRNVLVGTNSVVVQPTNFWSADATNARSGLGLGSAATNPASAFQSSSLVLSNLASSNGLNLTNIAASNIVGTLSIVRGGTGSTNVSDARSALGLGTAATNPSSAFQPASTILSNLSLGNGSNLTNVTASGISFSLAISNTTGLQAALDGKLATNGSAAGLTNFPTFNQNTTGTASNVTGVVSIVNGGTGATNAADARTALGLGTSSTNPSSAFQPASSALTNLAANNGGSLTNIGAANIIGTVSSATNVSGVVALANGGTGATNASGARSALELGTAATNPSTAFQPSSSVLTNISLNNGGSLTNIVAANIVGTVGLASNITGTAPLATNVTGVVGLVNGGTGGTNAASARTSLGATTIGANLFTLANPDDVRFIRLNANNTVSMLSALDMRTALSVGTNLGTVTSVGMTVPSIFSLSTPTITSSGTFAITLANQTSRQVFIAPNGGGIPAFRALDSDDLPSLAISKITGLQSALDGKLSTTGTAALATNVTGVVGLVNGGTGGTNAESGRTGLGATTIGAGLFTLANPSAIRFIRLNADNTVSSLSDSDFRTAIGLGTAATNPATAFQPSSANLTNLASNNGANLTNISVANVVGALSTNGNGAGLTNLTAANVAGTVALASNVTGTIAISNGGSGATTAGGARTNFGLGATWLTNTVASNFRTEIGLGATNIAFFGGLNVTGSGIEASGILLSGSNAVLSFEEESAKVQTRANLGLGWSGLTNTSASAFRSALEIGTTNTLTIAGVIAQNLTVTAGGGITLQSTLTNAASFRTNIGLPWTGLTNTNAATFQTALFGTNTNPVLVNTNGEVISPTNFWQVAPINTRVQYSQPVVNATNAATNARNLYLYSLAISTTGITNTITLPTNAATFFGDVTTVIHEGPTSSVTAVRQLGSSTNLITLNQFQEAVKFIYNGGGWGLADNISYVEPIYFSGTNAAANAAASRANLGLGATDTVEFSSIVVGDTNVKISTSVEDNGIGLSVQRGTNAEFGVLNLGFLNNTIEAFVPIGFNNNTSNAAITRTNLGLGLPALTNTNSAGFQRAIFSTNSAPTNSANINTVNFNTAVAWMEISVVTNNVTNSYRIPLFQ